MREDKLIRPAVQDGFTGPLLAAAKRAAMQGDDETVAKIVAQLGSLSEVARATRDAALVNQCERLLHGLKAIVTNPGGAFVMETKVIGTKSARPMRSTRDDSLEIEAVKRGAVVGTIEGYGAVFGNTDLGRDKILPGAFARTLREWKAEGRLPAMLAVHDSGSFPVGAWTDMREDSHGLRVTGKIADTPRGREAYSLITMTPSALDGLSIGYSINDGDHDRSGVRLLNELTLYEVSLVALPMNPLARIDTGKSRTNADAALSDAFAKLRAAVAEAEGADLDSNVITFCRAVEEPSEAEVLAALTRLNSSLRAASRR